MTQNNKYTITVYAICKNEEKFVDKWFASMCEADHIVVLDTGSTDNTVAALQQKGVTVVQKEISPWRFDVARNESMTLIPENTDICVCTDLDEILRPGWAKILRDNWSPDLDRVRYTYIWSFDKYGKPAVVFDYEKIHPLHTHEWFHAVHEVLHRLDGKAETRKKYLPQIVLEHHPDPTKSRGSYLGLLELDVQERPQDDRARHYYGRELMYHRRYDEAIAQLKIHLGLKSAVWDAERCASMRYIAKCSQNVAEKEKWLYKAIAEAPHLREPWIDMAMLQYGVQNWYGVVYFAEKALQIKVNQHFYTNDPNAWNETANDLLSIAYWYLGNKEKAIQNVDVALQINPHNERIINNRKLMIGENNSDENKNNDK